MNIDEQKKLKKEISSIKRLNIEQKFLMFKYFLQSYLYSIIMFGFSNDVSEEVVKLHKEFSLIESSESDLLYFINKHKKEMDYIEAMNFIDYIDETNSNTIKYYLSQFDNANVSCDVNNVNRIIKDKKDFDTLIDTSHYKVLAYSLILTFDDIKKFLNYEEFFWYDISEKIEFIDSRSVSSNHFYGLHFLADDIKIVLPEIINFETCITSINILSDIHNKYYKKEDRNFEKEFEDSISSKIYKKKLES